MSANPSENSTERARIRINTSISDTLKIKFHAGQEETAGTPKEEDFKAFPPEDKATGGFVKGGRCRH